MQKKQKTIPAVAFPVPLQKRTTFLHSYILITSSCFHTSWQDTGTAHWHTGTLATLMNAPSLAICSCTLSRLPLSMSSLSRGLAQCHVFHINTQEEPRRNIQFETHTHTLCLDQNQCPLTLQRHAFVLVSHGEDDRNTTGFHWSLLLCFDHL